MVLLWASIGLVLVVVGYVVYLVAEAKREVDDAPRVPMFNCEKHGLISDKYILKLDVLSEKPIEYCPCCYEEKMKAAKKGT